MTLTLDYRFISSYTPGMVRLNLHVPEELRRKLKVVCALEGKDMSEVIRKLIEDYVEKAEKRKLIVLPKAKA
jgi:metal-responsive CopG/Arc/MetJ family transcriptional regulator